MPKMRGFRGLRRPPPLVLTPYDRPTTSRDVDDRETISHEVEDDFVLVDFDRPRGPHHLPLLNLTPLTAAPPTPEVLQFQRVKAETQNRLLIPEVSEEEIVFDYSQLAVHGFIASGRFGRVYKMEYIGPEFQYVMAVKKIVTVVGETTPGEKIRELKMLLTEIDAIKRADCEFIVKFFGITFNEVDCCVCMEFMDLSLEQAYRLVHTDGNQYFDEHVLGAVAFAIVSGLHYMKKEFQIIHRGEEKSQEKKESCLDVKPSNILLNQAGQVKICDFGISGYLENSEAHTREVGCMMYMAPERVETAPGRRPGYGVKSDVWSLGISLVEVAMGLHPFANATLLDLTMRILRHELPRIPEDLYGAETRDFIHSCLLRDVESRPSYLLLMQYPFFRAHDHFNEPNLQTHVAKFVYELVVRLSNMPPVEERG